MKELIEKFIKIESTLSEEKGDFNLFGLFLREDSANNKWDLLVSAGWVEENKYESLKIISQKIRDHLENHELVNLSRIVLLEDNNPELEAFSQTLNIEHGCVEIKKEDFFGLEIRQAFIITSRNKTAKAS